MVTFNHGGGRHQWDVPYQEMRLFEQVCDFDFEIGETGRLKIIDNISW